MVSVLTTDFGPHPSAAWAQVTAERLLPDDSPAARAQASTLLRLRANFMDILTKHHGAAQEHERSMLNTSDQHFEKPHDGPTDFDALLAELRDAAKGTMWEAHLAKDEVAAAMREVVHDHTNAIRHVERLWHADNNPHLERGQAYRAKHGLPPSPTR
jgi:hypothetical protein